MFDLELHTIDNPQRPPDWKFRIAKYLLETGKRVPRNPGGSSVTRACRFMASVSAANTKEPSSLVQSDPDLGWAWRIYVGPEQRVRWELEARLLTNETPADIGTKMGISEKTVKLYADVFFDVIEKPASYINHLVLRTGEERFSAERGQELLWKTVAYRFGSVALDAVVYGDKVALDPARITSQEILRQQVEQVRLYQSAVVASMGDLSRLSAEGPAQAAASSGRRADKNYEMIEAENNKFKEGFQSLLESLPWTNDAARVKKLKLIHPLEEDGVGLRAHELMQAAANQLPQKTIDEIKSAKYPPPTKSTAVTLSSMQNQLGKGK